MVTKVIADDGSNKMLSADALQLMAKVSFISALLSLSIAIDTHIIDPGKNNDPNVTDCVRSA